MYREAAGESDPGDVVPRRLHRRRSVQSVAVAAGCRAFVKNAVRIWALRPNLSWPFAAIDFLAGLVPWRGQATIRQVRLPHCRAELISAHGVSTSRAVLYLHGGAFLACGLNTHRSMVARLSRAADAVVLNVGYRMLPRHAVTDALADCVDALQWLRRQGYPPDSVVVAGDSAGGMLAFMLALNMIECGDAAPAGIATVSPLTDLDSARRLAHPNARRCAMFSGRVLPVFAKYVERCHKRLSAGESPCVLVPPVDADLSRMPPVAIHAGGDELLLHDAELMARRLTEAGVRCDLHVWQGQVHDFPLAADILPEGRRAIRYLGDFIAEVTVPRETLAA
ncbi:esterase [Mycobacterium sp. 852002-51163_SCH5372311]|uniref:alpha/beta hydrolase n=1 Tax=Mycobacterium sp. 852002-51163_SCH5372311 TaxID=1834097 RepID=UPI0008002546|nr:alpha/beta hydrolase [Mycobacterium sp. 852002-51163_SCH5372311]OBF87267.1 esterase [Mycobacterium sp. 852002-51163_SCH5372311]